MTLVDQLLPWVEPEQQAGVEQWQQADRAPCARLLKLLVKAHNAHEPWASVLVWRVLEALPQHWSGLTHRLYYVRKAWQGVWQAQGCPTALANVCFKGLTYSQQKPHIAIGHALECAVLAGRAPLHLGRSVRALLPEHWLDSAGWDNLAFLPTPVVTLLQTRAGSGKSEVLTEHLALLKSLHSYRHQVWVTSLACGVAALLGEKCNGRERNAPGTIRGVVERVNSMLERVFSHRNLSDLSQLNVDRDLVDYAKGQYGGPNASVRFDYIEAYQAIVDAQARLLAANPPDVVLMLQAWCLPTFRQPLNLPVERAEATKARRDRRAREVTALLPLLGRLLLVIARRAEVFQVLHSSAESARQQHAALGGDQPVAFSVPLPDGSATMMFRVIEVTRLHRELYGDSTSVPAALCGQVLTQYLGTRDAQGDPLPDPFFVVLYRGYYDPVVQAELVRAGHRRCDLSQAPRSGLLRPPGALETFCRRHTVLALAQGVNPPVLFDMDALCMGMGFGALALMVACATGMRVHEVQQLQVGNSGTTFYKEGRLHCKVYPKAQKRDRARAVEHTLDPAINPVWREVVRLYGHRWGTWRSVAFPSGAELGLEPQHYLFQWARNALTDRDITILVRCVASGVWLDGEDGRAVVLVMHLLRYGYTQMRLKLGHQLAEIQRGLGHKDAATTRLYVNVIKSSGRLKIPEVGTLWDTMVSRAGMER